MKTAIKKIFRKRLPVFLFLLISICASAQEKLEDTIHAPKKNNIFHYAMRFLKRNSADTITAEGLLTAKSEDAFLPYEGKVISHIIINRYSFERSFIDTAKKINYFGTRILNSLHTDTREWAIRDNLFIKPHTKLLAYRLADNERYLRSLEYIQDARILIKPVLKESDSAGVYSNSDELTNISYPKTAFDSVDVYIITKDLFSLTGELNSLTSEKFKLKVSDANVMGIAQKVQVNTLIEKSRNPASGIGLFYTKYNIAGTFIDASAGITTIAPNLYDATNDEHAYYFSLQRQLISQYSHAAGGLSTGHYQTFNEYNKPAPYFFSYSYNTFDAWFGYNLSVEKFIKDRDRKAKQFISLRYFTTDFLQTPSQVADKLNFRFNNKQAVLGQFTFFRQQFYKTNYIYNFGTTEDIPYGYNVAVTAGLYKQSYLQRVYAGIDANRYIVTSRADIIQYFFRAGTFFNKGEWQDAEILLGGSGFSRLLLFKNFKLRQYLRLTYTHQFNRLGLDPLNINNTFGVRYFNSDSTLGDQRISLHTETISFINYKAFGFKFSPFAFFDVSVLTPEHEPFSKSGSYYGVGGGLRTRNENLIFGTTELRFVFFPRKAQQSKSFEASIRINIAFKYNNNYVQEPDIIQLNSDYRNNVY